MTNSIRIAEGKQTAVRFEEKIYIIIKSPTEVSFNHNYVTTGTRIFRHSKSLKWAGVWAPQTSEYANVGTLIISKFVFSSGHSHNSMKQLRTIFSYQLSLFT